MAPIKFDDTIKDKLEKRSLQPSSDAWNTLSDRLDTHEKKNSRRLFFYIGIAASIVGALFVTTQFFSSSEDHTVSPQIVDTKIKENQVKSDQITNLETPENSVVISDQDNIPEKENTKEFESPMASSIKNEAKVADISEEKQVTIKKENTTINDFKIKEVVAWIDNKTSIKNEAVVINKLTPEQVKVLDVVSQIKQLEADGIAATDQEIEGLLKQAEKDILKQRIYNETTRTVDAGALLQDVEQDLEQSFRTQVFEVLKSSYKTVKTAVAERNN
ncbi:MAG: hypothetical protein V7719_03305 [Psychroserpens sp.]|uniref:hypothetical protein n=1 Tax=Psychroserpens sp. TaxID=2020870 RepID=UPI0030029F07